MFWGRRHIDEISNQAFHSYGSLLVPYLHVLFSACVYIGCDASQRLSCIVS